MKSLRRTERSYGSWEMSMSRERVRKVENKRST